MRARRMSCLTALLVMAGLFVPGQLAAQTPPDDITLPLLSPTIYFRIWQFLADLLIYGPTDFVDRIVEILNAALSAKSLGRMTAIVVNGLIDLAGTSLHAGD